MNYKKVFKRETKVIAYVVIALTLVVIGTSYALFLQVNNNQDNQVVTAGSLVIEYAKGNTVTVDENAENNCLKPQSDETGSSTSGCNFTLSITNKGTLPMQYDLLIYNNTADVDIPSDAQFVDHSLVRHSLNKQYSQEGSNSETITSAKALSELDLKENKRVLENSVIGVGETITFSLNIWISEDATVDIIGQYVYLKLDVVGSVYEGTNFNDYLVKLSETDSSIEKIEHEATNQTTDLTEYRYIGKNINNYVCFGSEKETCPEDNLYRIIGVIPTQSEIGKDKLYINRVKLIKENNYEGTKYIVNGTIKTISGKGYMYTTNTSGDNRWEESLINKEVLNEEYLGSLGIYQKYIANSVWYLGAGDGNSTLSPEKIYQGERGSVTSGKGGKLSDVKKIGLMYASDYAFSIGKNYSEQLVSSNKSLYISNSWLYVLNSTYEEWTITTSKGGNTYPAFVIRAGGYLDITHSYNGANVSGMRPTFYLNENVIIKGGKGTKGEPYRVIV